jgi:hypothetical protein
MRSTSTQTSLEQFAGAVGAEDPRDVGLRLSGLFVAMG